MDRRAFIGMLAGGFLATPLAAGAQQAETIYRIGFLSTQSSPTLALPQSAFKQKLRELGYVDGRNLVIDD
jgi:hypothetical protein